MSLVEKRLSCSFEMKNTSQANSVPNLKRTDLQGFFNQVGYTGKMRLACGYIGKMSLTCVSEKALRMDEWTDGRLDGHTLL